MEKISENEVLNAFNLLIPYLQIFFDNEASIAISDTEVYLKNIGCSSLTLRSDPGDPIPSGGGAYKAIREGRTIISNIPKELYGTAIKSYSIPIKGASGKVEGTICVAKSLKKREELLELSKNLSDALKDISKVANEFTEKLQIVVEMNKETAKRTDEAQKTVSSTDKIFGFINQVTSQTDLLGINASIEATRAGAEGKGFKVIAQEIRKLSETSRKSVDKINQMLSDINKSVEDICDTTSKTQEITETFSSAFSEIATSVEKLSTSAQHIEIMTDKI